MIKNFDEIKKQLGELAPVINSFENESVQLRIVELVFQGADTIKDVNQDPIGSGVKGLEEAVQGKKRVSVTTKEVAKKTAKKQPAKKAKSQSGRPGPGAIVDRLIGEGFFDKPKTSADIIEHCKTNLAYTYVTSELSVSLTRAMRSAKLKREKNSDKQFEYVKA